MSKKKTKKNPTKTLSDKRFETDRRKGNSEFRDTTSNTTQAKVKMIPTYQQKQLLSLVIDHL